MYIEAIRVASGMPVLVAGDFNTEWVRTGSCFRSSIGEDCVLIDFLQGSLLNQDSKAEEWVAFYTSFGSRELLQTGKPTMMHHVPKVSVAMPFRNVDGATILDFSLVSHNIQHFTWALDNPFNSSPSKRKRGMVLKNYLQRFDVVALQEVSQKVMDPPAPDGDDEKNDESEDEKQVQKTEEKDPYVAGTLFNDPIAKMDRKDSQGPLSQAGNLVKISGAGNQKHCDTVRLYDYSGKWDIKIW
ncbi:hypothetical protein HDU86_004054 [Geranomyces michiganensis]|nr:hypothetical protein HDU86_004054 [Geranomyces michiganensis]